MSRSAAGQWTSEVSGVPGELGSAPTRSRAGKLDSVPGCTTHFWGHDVSCVVQCCGPGWGEGSGGVRVLEEKVIGEDCDG